MITKQLTDLGTNVCRVFIKNQSKILTGVGLSGMIFSTYKAITATPKALDLIKAAEKEKGDKLTKTEIVKTVWKPYLPVVLAELGGAACIIGAQTANEKRYAALVTAYGVTEQAFSDYKQKVTETIGKKKAEKIVDDISKDKIAANPVTNNEVIITGKGDVLCYEPLSGRYFKSDVDKIRSIQNDLNADLINEMYVSLNELFYALGLNQTPLGESLGWNIGKGKIDISFSAQVADNNEPCIVLKYDRHPPTYDYMSLH